MSRHSDLARFAVFTRTKEPLEQVQCQLPSLQPGEVLVEVLCCTLCGSDLHTWSGRRPAAGPTILGHEILGRVIGVTPPADARAELGQRVTWTLCDSCGSCFYCREGLSQKCERLFKYGHETVSAAPLSGGLATHCVLRPGTSIFPVPEALRDETACPANCATATVMAASRRGRL